MTPEGVENVSAIYRARFGGHRRAGGEHPPGVRVRAPPGRPDYIESEPWLAARSALRLGGAKYHFFRDGEGVIAAEAVQPITKYRGFHLFAARNDDSTPRFVYLPVRPGCVFQTYRR